MKERTPNLIFEQIFKEDSGCVSYLIGSRKDKVAAVVDPLIDIERYLQLAERKGLVIRKVIDTHTHADHLSGKKILATKTHSEVIMHEDTPLKFPFTKVADKDVINIGDVEVKVIYTPGHTYDHICLRVDRKVLTGDTLLIGDVGRTDLGGNHTEKSKRLYESLFRKLVKLPEDTEVYPTHIGGAHYVGGGVKSTIKGEKENNSALKVSDLQGFIKYMSEGWPPKPPDYQNIVRVNLGEVRLQAI